MKFKLSFIGVVLIITVLIIISVSRSYSDRLPETIVRIGILSNESCVNIACDGPYFLCDLDSGNKEEYNDKNIHLVRAVKDGFLISDKKILSSNIRLTVKSDGDFVLLNGKGYYDSIILKKIKNKITVINELGLESYLGGILTREVNPEWPEEALKAQAVVSRTFALANLKKHSRDGYDLCNTVHCQVYGGLSGYDERTNKAIRRTRGKVLTYRGRLIDTVFHACCGGHTANVTYVWSDDTGKVAPKYLSGIKCNYCKDSPHFRWSRTIDGKFIKNELIDAGFKNISRIKRIKSSKRDSSGRYNKIEIVYENSNGDTVSFSLTSSKFRMIVSPFIMRSTKLESIESVSDNKFRFKGYGWGHGVGLCQWGAKGMADEGYKYREILEYYYPSSIIEKWEE